MSTNIIPFAGQAPTKAQGRQVDNDLGAGIAASYGLVGFKGKVWSIRYKGNEKPLMRPDNDGPVGSIDVVVLAASKHLSKIFYEGQYVEGSNAAPDCFSNNGVTPEPGAAKKQANVCASCPKNAWGSRVTPAGKQGKACSDSKRIAVVPINDLRNEAFGGPMLLRVPAASLGDLAAYGDKLKGMNVAADTVVTKIGFDHKEAYPKFVFTPTRYLTDLEYDIVEELSRDPRVTRILSEGDGTAPAPVAPPPAIAGTPPKAALPPPTPAPVTNGNSGPGGLAPEAPPVTPKVTEVPTVGQTIATNAFEAELDAELKALLPG